ncbi:MAG: HAD family phosphatase [Roseobacter sp.]|nr:HAD family phosphatase [Roseobacter sp.]
MPPDMVLFDCDGVLVDSEPLTADVLCCNLVRHGLDMTPEKLGDLFLGGTLMGVGETARAMGAQLPDTWLADTYEEIFAALGAAVEPIAGAAHVLDRLDAAGIPYAVCSNGPHRKMDITLGRTGLIGRLRGRVYSREDVAEPKPAPDVYLKAAADAGVDPARCVVVEDSPNGACAGVAAGMCVFGFAAETPAAKLAPVASLTFDRMQDLPGLLGL